MPSGFCIQRYVTPMVVKAKAAAACDVPPIDLGQVFDVRNCRASFIRSAQRNLELELASASNGTRLAAR